MYSSNSNCIQLIYNHLFSLLCICIYTQRTPLHFAGYGVFFLQFTCEMSLIPCRLPSGCSLFPPSSFLPSSGVLHSHWLYRMSHPSFIGAQCSSTKTLGRLQHERHQTDQTAVDGAQVGYYMKHGLSQKLRPEVKVSFIFMSSEKLFMLLKPTRYLCFLQMEFLGHITVSCSVLKHTSFFSPYCCRNHTRYPSQWRSAETVSMPRVCTVGGDSSLGLIRVSFICRVVSFHLV